MRGATITSKLEDHAANITAPNAGTVRRCTKTHAPWAPEADLLSTSATCQVGNKLPEAEVILTAKCTRNVDYLANLILRKILNPLSSTLGLKNPVPSVDSALGTSIQQYSKRQLMQVGVVVRRFYRRRAGPCPGIHPPI